MTTYNTGNPLGSTDPRDLFDNAQNTDDAVNGEGKTWVDRFGRTRVSMKGVEEAVPDAIAARDITLLARDAAIAAAGPLYATEAEGRAAVADGESFNVQGSGSVAAYVYRRLSASSSELIAEYPSAESVSQLQQLISESNTEVYETLIAGDGGILREYTSAKTADAHHEVSQISGVTALGSDDGGIALYSDEEKTIVGPIEVRYTDLPGVHVVDPETGGILQTLSDVAPADPSTPSRASVLDGGVFFSNTLVGFAGKSIALHVPSMLADRQRHAEVTATVSSNDSLGSVTGDDVLHLDASQFGAAATLSLREKSNTAEKVWRTLSVFSVPATQGSEVSPVVLLIGDSISNRQGAFLIDKYCREAGVTPTFVGTMGGRGSNNSDSPLGPLGEGREGWRGMDFIYGLTDKCAPVAVGDESAYMAMSKSQKLNFNPFIRPATGGDAPETVRNGFVFDVAFYLSRFGLADPTVVIYAGGTNDIGIFSESDIREAIKVQDILIIGQIRAALPNAKIIRTFPGTAMDAVRDLRWPKYAQITLGIRDAEAYRSDPNVCICPAWALANQEGGYALSDVAPDADTGFSKSQISDGVHPIGSARHQMYQSLAAYVSAASIGLI